MFESVEALAVEHAELEAQLADPDLHADAQRAKRVGRRYNELTAIVRTYERWQQACEDLTAARELAAEDEALAAEAQELAGRVDEIAHELERQLVPRDPADDKNVIMEIKGGAGGEESALFAGDLFRMYSRFAERHGWRMTILDVTETALGGYKSVTASIEATGGTEVGNAPYALLKFEGGVHRVQRVPVTESQGRIHTSAAGVLVMAEAEEIDIDIHENDLRIDAYRSSGPGGQSVNTTDSAIRITHLPTGVVVNCQNEKSQLQNKEQALRILRARLLEAAQQEAEAEAEAERKSQVRTVDRSERVRTYNFPENRLTDHRTGFKAHNLDVILEGALDDVIDSLIEADTAERMAAV